jgi:signal transduction histidine kinase
MARVSVSDTGIGIEEDQIPYIFDRFYKAGGVRGAGDGFGLGLSIARSVIEAHKGAIDVESQPGKGSTFIVSLPISYPG